MRAARIHEEGDVDVVVIDDVPTPEPGPGEARVQLRASALNHIDIWIRLGKPSRPKPHTLGADGAGVIDALGPGVSGLELGAEVVINPGLFCGTCSECRRGEQSLCPDLHVMGEHVNGTHADFCCVPVQNLHPKPERLSWPEAAAYPLAFATAWRMLVSRAELRTGEWVLVWGAGSGVGSAAVTIAAALGARVIATASRAETLAAARTFGAEHTINHASDDVLAAVREITGGHGVDVVFEHVGEATWKTSIEALRKGGRLVTTGATTGGNPPARIHRIFWKQLSILGSTMASDSDFRAVTDLVARGRANPIVDSVLPLEQVRDAQRRLEAGLQIGKIVLGRGR